MEEDWSHHESSLEGLLMGVVISQLELCGSGMLENSTEEPQFRGCQLGCRGSSGLPLS